MLGTCLSKGDDDDVENEKEEEQSREDIEFKKGYISLKFNLSNGKLIAPIQIGTPVQEMNLVLDIGSMRTWVSDKYFKKESSSSYKEIGEKETKNQYDITYSGVQSTETFTKRIKRI